MMAREGEEGAGGRRRERSMHRVGAGQRAGGRWRGSKDNRGLVPGQIRLEALKCAQVNNGPLSNLPSKFCND